MHKYSIQLKIPILQKIILIIFGLFVFFFLLEAGLRLGGFILLSLQEHRNMVSMRQKSAYRIMCLGESTTVGDEHMWPSQLENILNQRNIVIKFSVINKSVGGTNTSYILKDLEDNLSQYKPDMVITMMGVNDFAVHMPYEDMVSPPKIIVFFRHFKIYKLARLIWLHIVTKAKEMGIYEPKENKVAAKLHPGIGLKEGYAEEKNFGQTKETFKRGTDLNSEKEEASYIELGEQARLQGKYTEAEELLKKALELKSVNTMVFDGLRQCYRELGKAQQGEETFKRAIELNPKNHMAYCELGWCYLEQKKYSQAEESFKEAIELSPWNEMVYLELARCYRDQGKYAQAEESFKKAIELNPKNSILYLDLAWFYRDYQKGRYDEAEEMFRKALELEPHSSIIYMQLARRYREQGKYIQAEEMFKKAIELDRKNDKFYGGMALVYKEIGNNKLAEEYYLKANHLRLKYCNPVTAHNYQVVKRILDKRGIKLVCVQYPMRSVEPLKKIFEGQEGIIFVNNEKVFKKAVEKEGYEEYFTDMFGGDFGHCTPKGNRLLAENIAEVITKELFNKIKRF